MTRRLADPTSAATAARRRRTLGWGLESAPIAPGADVGRDLVLRVDDDGRRDLGVVEGIDNLTQCLTIALTTALGDDVFNTAFGFDGLRALVEETDPALTRERVRVAVAAVLRADPRVARIVDLQALPRTPAEPSGRILTVACVVEAVSGEPVTLTVEGGTARG